MIPLVLLALATIYPVLAILGWVSKRDQLPEPPAVVRRTAILGGLAVIPILVVEMILVTALGLPEDIGAISTVAQALAMGFVVAALTEESFKFLVLRGYAARHDAFDEPFDGIVYGVAASLGFALVENVMYVLGGWMESGVAGGFTIAIMRALTAVPMHAACGVIMGACIGIGRFQSGRGWMVLGFLGAVALHGAYDAFLMAIPAFDQPEPIALCVVGFLMVFILGLVVSGLAIARMRRDQARRMEWDAMSSDLPPVPAAASSPTPSRTKPTATGVPGWPLASLVVAGASAAVFVGLILMIIVVVGQEDTPSDTVDTLVGLAVLGTLLLALVAVPLSIIALLREPRWRFASVLSLLCGLAETGLIVGLVILGMTAEA